MSRGRVKGTKFGSYRKAMPSYKAIGIALGMPEKTAFSLCQRGLVKLKKAGALEGLLELVQAVALSEREILHAGSVECDREYAQLWNNTEL